MKSWVPRRRAGLTRRLVTLLLLVAALSLPGLVQSASNATVGVDDYPSRLKNAAQDSLVDPWLFYNRECTSFVAWRLTNDGKVDFDNYYLGEHWGNASNWKYAATQVGVPVDSTPHVGAVAWWAAGSAGSSRGHVAWVMSVSKSSITIEEYNYLSAGHYDQRTIASDSSKWPTAFLHIGGASLRNTARPTVSGTPQVGVRLSATHGSWSPSGASFSYQWLADGAAISNATRRGYTPRPSVLGKQISVRVTASLAGARSATATSAPTAAVAPGKLVVSAAPTITGTAQVDRRLSATTGTWSPSASYAYQWLANGTPVPGATASTFTPTASMLRQGIRVRVTASRTGYTTASSTSDPTDGVIRASFATVGTPKISGTPQVDHPLTVSPGTWSPTGTPTYQWLVDGTPVPGATGTTYTPTPDDLRHQVTVKVTMTRPGYTTASSASAASDPVLPGTFLNASDPTVTGTPRVGLTLTADPGSWSPDATLSYQWLAAGSPVTGATGKTFTPTSAQLGRTVTVQVTARRPGYLTALAESKPTTAVTPGTITSVTRPEVSGSPVVGTTLTASAGTWSVSPTKVAYQWYADGTAITGATTRTYTPTQDVLDRRLTVRVTVSADGYSPASATSVQTTPVVLGRAAFTSASTLTGTTALGEVLTAHAGAHTPSTASVTYQWLRGGRPIPGATGSTYTLAAADVGTRVGVELTLTAPHWAPATTRVTADTRVKSVPRLEVRPSVDGHRVVLRFSVVAPGISGPDGTARVTEGGRTVGRVTVTDGHGRLVLTQVPSGVHRYVATYWGPMQRTVTGKVAVTVP